MEKGKHNTSAILKALLVLVVCSCLGAASAFAQAKKGAKVRSYDPSDSVLCPDNYSYTPAKGCIASRGRINQLSMDGRSPIIGLARCMPEILSSSAPETTFIGDGSLNGGQMIQLEDGNVIIANVTNTDVVFRRFDVDMRAQGALKTLVSANEGFDEHNQVNDDNLAPLPQFHIAPLDGARWVLVFAARSAQRDEAYVMGVVINGDVPEEPSVTKIVGTEIFPISYQGKLFVNSSTLAVKGITSESALQVAGFKKADGTFDGRFMVAWVREDYLKPSQRYSIFGKIYNESIAEAPPAVRFGMEQGTEIRLENTTGDLGSTTIMLRPLRSTQGMALAYNDANNYSNMFAGATEIGAVRLFETDGDLYKTGNNVVGVVGNIRNITNIEELSSGTIMVLHKISANLTDKKRISASIINALVPATPTLVDLNGADPGVAQTIISVKNDIYKQNISMLPDDRTRIYLTWAEDLTGNPAEIRSMMLKYEAGTPGFRNVSQWVRVDPGAATHPVRPTLVSFDYDPNVLSLHMQTLTTPTGSEHYFLSKYDRTSGGSVYRYYKVPDCW